ncbi:MAG: TetR/AcrR family transcriptional regulator [Pyrinomonadaceae bacterium]
MRDAVQMIDTREAILDATDRLLARYGYRKMTIDDLAKEAGIGKGTVYLYFPSKEEIALSHIDRIVERLIEKLQEIAAGPGTAEQKLVKMLLERVVLRFDSVQHYTLGLNELLAELRPKLLERRRRHFEEEAGIIAGVIGDGQNAGRLTTGDALEIAQTLLSATNSLLPYSLSVIELGDRTEVEKQARRTAELLIRGLIK